MLAMLSFMKVTSCEILTPACLNSVAIMVTQPSAVGLEPKGGTGEVVEADSQRKRMGAGWKF